MMQTRYTVFTTLPLVVAIQLRSSLWGGKCPEMGIYQKNPTRQSAIEPCRKVFKTTLSGGFFAYRK